MLKTCRYNYMQLLKVCNAETNVMYINTSAYALLRICSDQTWVVLTLCNDKGLQYLTLCSTETYAVAYLIQLKIL